LYSERLTFTVLPLLYLRTSRSWTPCPSGTRKRNGHSDSIRSMGVRGGSPVQRQVAEGGVPHPQAQRHHLGHGHAPHYLQPRFRASNDEIQAHKRDPFVVQTSAPNLSGSGKAPVISMERSGQSLTLSRSIV
jgi:hypothetical protein